MNFTGLFIRRPVMTTLVMLGIFLFGAISYPKLSVSDLPTVDFPTISVYASLPGASPETMAATVATPLERVVLDHRRASTTSRRSSSQSSTSITIQFSLDRRYRRRRAGRERGDLDSADQPPVEHHPAVLPQAEPGGRADPVSSR